MLAIRYANITQRRNYGDLDLETFALSSYVSRNVVLTGLDVFFNEIYIRNMIVSYD